MPVRIPKQATLDKYGLTADEFLDLYAAQKGLCGLCGETLVGHLVNIDHHHHRRWKERSAEFRKRYVRGLLHARCNRFLLGPTYYGFTSRHFRQAADYLDRWAHLAVPREPA